MVFEAEAWVRRDMFEAVVLVLKVVPEMLHACLPLLIPAYATPVDFCHVPIDFKQMSHAGVP